MSWQILGHFHKFHHPTLSIMILRICHVQTSKQPQNNTGISPRIRRKMAHVGVLLPLSLFVRRDIVLVFLREFDQFSVFGFHY